MATYSVTESFQWDEKITDKVALVCRMFGLTVDRLRKNYISFNCRLNINSGDIVYITGPSGSGKSVILAELEKAISARDRVNLARIKLPADKALIDCLDGDFLNDLRMLSTAGLNDVFCILNQPNNLSDGQRYRFRLAKALAKGKKYIFADEFCSNLDRITAAVISHNIRKYAKRTGVTFILASSHDDILLDLMPDVLVAQELTGQTRIIYKYGINQKCEAVQSAE